MNTCMKKYIDAALVFFLGLSAMSCVVEAGTESARTRYSLMGYSEVVLARPFMYDPLSVVALSREVDYYFSLPEADREAAEKELFPEGLRWIDENSLNIIGVASVIGDGNRFGEEGSRWIVKFDPRSFAISYAAYQSFYDYYYYGNTIANTVSYEILCKGEGTWSVLSKANDGVVEYIWDDDIIVNYAGDASNADGPGLYTIRIAPITVTEDDLNAVGETVGDPVTAQYSRKVVSFEDSEYFTVDRSINPVAGRFDVSFYRGNEKLDYCSQTFTANGVKIDVSQP